MQIYYIRHGQSANNQLYAESGSEKGRIEDPPLTELGRQQARLLAEHLHHGRSNPTESKVGRMYLFAGEGSYYEYNLTHIYTSLMTRAVQTAAIISRKLRLPMIGLVDLFETGGIYLEDEDTGEKVGKPGKTPAELRRDYPDLVLPEGLPEDGWYNRPHENREDRLPRAKRVLEELISRHGGTTDRIALISHGGFFQYFMSAVLGLAERPPVWFLMNNAAITRVDVGERFDIIYMNRTQFMPEDMLT